MRKIFFYFFLLYSAPSYAQSLRDFDGRPYTTKAPEGYEGSPFLFEKWTNATVITATGKVYKDMLVNLDINQGVVLFMSQDSVYMFSENITEVSLTDAVPKITFRKGKLIHPDLPDVYLEIVSDSPVFLKRYERQLVEGVTYGTNAKTFRYSEGKTYYTVLDGKLQKIDLTKENAQKVFAQKWEAVNAFVQVNKLSYTKEDTWRKMADKYLSNQ